MLTLGAKLLIPSRAKILRLDMRLLGCPGTLTDLYSEVGGESRPIFTKEDVLAVRKLLGRDDLKRGEFVPEYDLYLDLCKRYYIPIYGYGTFVHADSVEALYREVDRFNAGAVELRKNVCGLLHERYTSCTDRDMHPLILRFNPRIKANTYILSESFVEDKAFRRGLEIALEKLKINMTVQGILG